MDRGHAPTNPYIFSLNNLLQGYNSVVANGLRTSAALQELRFDAGSLALNLAATLGRRGSEAGRRVERLPDIAALQKWCDGVGIQLARDVGRPELLRDLRSLREAVYETAQAALSLRRADPAALREINRRAAARPPVPSLRPGPKGPRVAAVGLNAAALCSVVARDLIGTLSSDAARARLRECSSGSCRMIYLLAAGARERRWCSMTQCGNRAKVAAHRARHAGQPA